MRTVNLISHAATVVITAVASILIYNHFYGPKGEGPVRTTPTPKEAICSVYDANDMSMLNVDLVHTMINTYKGQQWKFSNANNPMGDTNWVDAQSVWFDLESLKKFLYAIENEANQNDNSVTSSQLGVRFYYATYPGEKELRDFPDLVTYLRNNNHFNYMNRHTLVAVPTIQDTLGNNKDFNPVDHNTYQGQMLTLNEYKLWNGSPVHNPHSQTMLSLTGYYDNRSVSSKNHGTLTPPDQMQSVAF